eukprot:170382-Chlamydomonas_euryale.AAC.2
MVRPAPGRMLIMVWRGVGCAGLAGARPGVADWADVGGMEFGRMEGRRQRVRGLTGFRLGSMDADGSPGILMYAHHGMRHEL